MPARSRSPALLDINTLNGSVSGSAANFNQNVNYAWKFLVAGSGNPIAFDPSMFSIDLSGFLNDTDGQFSVARGDGLGAYGFDVAGNNELYVVYAAAIPEPSTLALAGLGLAGAGWAASRRRRRGRRGGR